VSKIILTVDDSRTMRDMLRLALVEAGFEVLQAEDGIHGGVDLRSGVSGPRYAGDPAHANAHGRRPGCR